MYQIRLYNNDHSCNNIISGNSIIRIKDEINK